MRYMYLVALKSFFGIAHVKADFILFQKLYDMPMLGMFVLTSVFVQFPLNSIQLSYLNGAYKILLKACFIQKLSEI